LFSSSSSSSLLLSSASSSSKPIPEIPVRFQVASTNVDRVNRVTNAVRKLLTDLEPEEIVKLVDALKDNSALHTWLYTPHAVKTDKHLENIRNHLCRPAQQQQQQLLLLLATTSATSSSSSSSPATSDVIQDWDTKDAIGYLTEQVLKAEYCPPRGCSCKPWHCTQCTFHNSRHFMNCEVCGAPSPPPPPPPVAVGSSSSSSFSSTMMSPAVAVGASSTTTTTTPLSRASFLKSTTVPSLSSSGGGGMSTMQQQQDGIDDDDEDSDGGMAPGLDGSMDTMSRARSTASGGSGFTTMYPTSQTGHSGNMMPTSGGFGIPPYPGYSPAQAMGYEPYYYNTFQQQQQQQPPHNFAMYGGSSAPQQQQYWYGGGGAPPPAPQPFVGHPYPHWQNPGQGMWMPPAPSPPVRTSGMGMSSSHQAPPSWAQPPPPPVGMMSLSSQQYQQQPQPWAAVAQTAPPAGGMQSHPATTTTTAPVAGSEPKKESKSPLS
jgi:hypothetical protein